MDVSAFKFAFTTRRVPHEAIGDLLLGDDRAPRAGDLVLARVLKIGQHQRLERPDGRRATLYPDDLIVVCFGNRYAPDQFEGRVPTGLGECSLLAAGGVAGDVLDQHARMNEATRLQPVAFMGDRSGRRLNLADFALEPRQLSSRRPTTIAVVGTSMNSGKTSAAASLIHGLHVAGVRVGAAKVTGTGAGGDPWLLHDAGADDVLDFLDAGEASTAGLGVRRLEEVLATLTGHLAERGAQAIVLEVADGLLQSETAELVVSPGFRAAVDGVVFAAAEAMGALAGARWLRDRDLPLVALSGVLTSSPLARREVALATDVPVVSREELAQHEVAEAVQRDVAGSRRQPRPQPVAALAVA